MKLFDIAWKHADEPDSSHSVTVVKKDIGKYMSTRSPLAKVIRQMEVGDSVVLVDGAGLRTITARCYDSGE